MEGLPGATGPRDEAWAASPAPTLPRMRERGLLIFRGAMTALSATVG
jgi:hypothetical protein